MGDARTGALPVSRAGPAADLFVGRREELGWLAGALHDSMQGQPRVVLLRGEAGIGKTRLLGELRRIALRSDVAVCLGRAYEDVAIPYLPFEPLFEEIGRRALHAHPGASEDIALVRELLRGGPARTRRADSAAGGEPGDDALAVFPAACRATLELARRRPTLVVLDDLHWADQASLHLFAHLVFGALDAGLHAPLRLLLVAAHRPVAPGHRLASVVARIEREAVGCTLEVEGLAAPELRELVEGITLATPSHDLVAKVGRATGGNPLYAREVVLSLEKRGVIHGERGRLVPEKLPEVSVPEQIARAVSARAEVLSPACRRALFLASFLGDRFSLERLAALGEWDPDELLDLLQEGVRQGFLAVDGDDFAFDHSLVRQAFQADTPVRRLRRIHAQVAALLAGAASRTGGASWQEVAQHWIEAGDAADPAEVARDARLAGDAAREALDPADAAAFYEAALAAAERVPGFAPAERAALHRLAGVARRDAGHGEACLAQLEAAITLYRELGDARGLVESIVDHAEARQVLRFVPYGAESDTRSLDEALALVGDGDPRLRASLWASTANVYFSARRTEEAKAFARKAIVEARRIGDARICASASGSLALAELQGLELREAVESFHQCIAYAREAGDTRKEGHALQRLPLALTWMGRLGEARAIAERASELAASVQDWAGRSHADAVLACIALARGDTDAVARHTRETLVSMRRSAYPWGAALALPALAAARALRGEWREAGDALDALVHPGRVFEDPGVAVRLLGGLQRRTLAVRAGNTGAAELEAQAAPDLGPWRRDAYAMQAVCGLAEIAVRLEQRELAAAVHPILADALERGMFFSASWIYLIPRLLGALAALRGDVAEAEAHFERASDVARREDATPELVQTALDHARLLRRLGRPGDDARAAALLAEALRGAEARGLAWLAARVREAASEGGATAPGLVAAVAPEPASATGLDRPERELVELLARGRDAAAIAEELVLGAGTVAERLEAVHAKTGIRGRAEALAYLVENGSYVASGVPALEGPTLRGRRPAAGASWAPPMPGMRVLLVSDIEGMTPLLQRLGDAAAREVLRAHNALIRDCLVSHGGVELQHTGDGFIAILRSPRDGVACAVEVQRLLAEWRRAHPEQPLHVRIGLHVGEALPEEGRLVGSAVNVAVRICSTAARDTILVSDAIQKLAGEGAFDFADRGFHALKGIDAPHHLYEVAALAPPGRRGTAAAAEE